MHGYPFLLLLAKTILADGMAYSESVGRFRVHKQQARSRVDRACVHKQFDAHLVLRERPEEKPTGAFFR